MDKVNVHKQYISREEILNLSMEEILEILPKTTSLESKTYYLTLTIVDGGKWSVDYYDFGDDESDVRFGEVINACPLTALRIFAVKYSKDRPIEVPEYWKEESIGNIPKPVQQRVKQWAYGKARTIGNTELLYQGAVYGWRYRMPEIKRLMRKITEQQHEICSLKINRNDNQFFTH